MLLNDGKNFQVRSCTVNIVFALLVCKIGNGKQVKCIMSKFSWFIFLSILNGHKELCLINIFLKFATWGV